MKRTNFSTESVNLINNEEHTLSFSQLISLIKDVEQEKNLYQEFNPDGEEFHIVMERIGGAFNAVKKWTEKFTYLSTELKSKDVDSYFVKEPDDTIDAEINDMIFNIPASEIDSQDGTPEKIKCRAIYDAKDQFYEELKIATHINFLKAKGFTNELQKINAIWKNHKIFEKKKKFRILKSKDNFYFLRSIVSEKFKEYGTAFTFVYTVLLLNEVSTKDKGTNFRIESLNLNESKISITFSQGQEEELEDVGIIKSSINMSNSDLGSDSFKMVSTITFTPLVNPQYTLNVEVPRKDGVNKSSIRADHKTSFKTMNEKFSNIQKQFISLEDFKKDYYEFLHSKKPEGLRSALEQKILASPILRESKELKELFKPAFAGVIDNYAKLINLCGKADALDIDYDIKSKLREIISDVLFTKK